MRWVLLPYLVVVAALAFCIGWRAGPPEPVAPAPTTAAGLVAARPLAPNRLLLPGDLRPAEDPMKGTVGRYVEAPASIPAGQPVPRMADQPDLWPARYGILLALPLPPPLDPRNYNAGREVQICHPVLTAPAPATIRALRCGPEGSDCIAVLEIRPGRAAMAAPALSRPEGSTICRP
jgi:hypothetical protein